MAVSENHINNHGHGPSDSEKVLIISGTLAVLYFVVTWTNLGYFLFVFFLGGVSSCVFTTWYLSKIFYKYLKNGVQEMDRAGIFTKYLAVAFSTLDLWRNKEPVEKKDEPKGPFSFAYGTTTTCGPIPKPDQPQVAKDSTTAAFSGSQAPVETMRVESATVLCTQCHFNIPLRDVVNYKGNMYHAHCVDQAIAAQEAEPAMCCTKCKKRITNSMEIRYRNELYHACCLKIRLQEDASANTCNTL